METRKIQVFNAENPFKSGWGQTMKLVLSSSAPNVLLHRSDTLRPPPPRYFPSPTLFPPPLIPFKLTGYFISPPNGGIRAKLINIFLLLNLAEYYYHPVRVSLSLCSLPSCSQ